MKDQPSAAQLADHPPVYHSVVLSCESRRSLMSPGACPCSSFSNRQSLELSASDVFARSSVVSPPPHRPPRQEFFSPYLPHGAQVSQTQPDTTYEAKNAL
ncbi:hypothetical protein FA95DRAFT_1556382 [Auriscalpium vulgare]|uniref:Uncharacterized protein n=1 Tax=Auriscalpium vulgare TaxID=40419 RepID=A0ACB8S1K6_9AGAM|nr:hypothetical protein FA95DRAFT_1556382 [Auriscalpium vulgare]